MRLHIRLSEANILLVDDEPMLLEIFGAWLGSHGGLKVHTALNGEDALAVISEQPIDVLITDVRMPVMDGVTLIRRLAERGVHIPVIIFVSGFGDIDEREMYSLGVEAFLPKPVRREELIGVLERGVAERSALWSEPMPQTPRQTLQFEVSSVDQDRGRELRLGRGGFCIRSPKPLIVGRISFRIAMGDNGREMVGQGYVRWICREEQTAGIEFYYVDPICRSWLLQVIADTSPRSYIPNSLEIED